MSFKRQGAAVVVLKGYMSVFSDTISRYLPIGRGKPKINKKQALAILPVRNAVVTWERKDKEIVLRVPLRDDKIARFVKKVIKHLPDTRSIALDEVGASVWSLCDGQRDINSVILSIAKDFKLTRREAEASVTMFLQTLAKKNLIGLMSAGGYEECQR